MNENNIQKPLSFGQSQQSGLGQVQQQTEVPANGYAYKRNSSLEMFELANAEKNKAKELQYENEAMKAIADQQSYKAENEVLKQNTIDNGIINALKNGQIDSVTANAVISDPRVSDSVKSQVSSYFNNTQNISQQM